MSRIDEGGIAHALYSASESKRWLNCAGSVALCAGLPERAGGEAAKQGTCAHHLVGRCLAEGSEASAYEGWSISLKGDFMDPACVDKADLAGAERFNIYSIVVDEDCYQAVQVILDVVAAERERLGPGHRMLLEKRFDLTWIRPDMFGTADVVLISDFDELVVIDYKHGKWIGVEVENNTQTRYYAVGVLHDEGWDFRHIKTIIVQPRKDHEDGPARDHTYTIQEMRDFAEELGAGVDRTKAPGAPLVAGEWCFFCQAGRMGKCPETKRRAYEAAALDFSAAGTPEAADPNAYDEVELLEALQAVPVVKAWARGVEARFKDMVIRRGRWGGKKVVQKLGRKGWSLKPEEVIEKLLAVVQQHNPTLTLDGQAFFDHKFWSPSKIGRGKYGKARKHVLAAIGGMTFRPAGGLAIVDEDDNRYMEVNPGDEASYDFDVISFDAGTDTEESDE